MKKIAWITWESQPRNRSVADLLNADLYEIIIKKSIFLRYFFSIKETLRIFTKEYEVIFVQNPSIVLCFFSVIFNFFFKKKLCIDAHNAGVRPLEGKFKILQIFNQWILKRANFVIVTNSVLENYLKEHKIKSVVVPDPLPSYDEKDLVLDKVSGGYVFVICSWAEDEPIKDYIEVARRYPDKQFYFSGNYRKFYKSPDISMPKNVKLLGFISKNNYISLLYSCDIALDLTLRDDCLVCGAYESISLNKKVIVTDNEVNRDLFRNAVIYSEPNVNSLYNAIRYADEIDLKKNILEFKISYQKYLDELREVIYEIL